MKSLRLPWFNSWSGNKDLASSDHSLLQATTHCLCPRDQNVSSSNKIERNSTELNITVYIGSWDKLWAKDTKKPNHTAATFEEPVAEAGYCAYPCTHHHLRGAKHESHLFSPTLGHTPTLSPYNKQARAHPLLGESASKGTYCSFSFLLL